jgi:hypothetical protein
MTMLLLGMSVFAGMGLGWFGHKAKLRIDLWGRNADQQDLIFQAAEREAEFDNKWPLSPFTHFH